MTQSAAVAPVLVDVARSLREAFLMFWVTLWPLILGFGLSGAVQAFVSRGAMQRKLGDHGPASVARATVYGMVSSSCSYAASAMAKSLVVRGADFVAAMAFMFASTNLVIELGIVLVVLMGWQFAASEFVGGAVMIVLLATVGGLWLRGRAVVRARERAVAGSSGQPAEHAEHADHALEVERSQAELHPTEASTGATRPRWRTASGWADSASYTMADLTMLRRELLIGYVVAGFLTVLVPASAWQAVFLSGHGFWTSLQNVIVGPLIALVSFVCSIGNVPLAAALWKGGISFGGVIAFIFADLITFPLLMVYRRQYGVQMMRRMLVVFWALMSTAALITEGIFHLAGLVPTDRAVSVAPDRLAWNVTTYLNLAFLALFAVLYRLARRRDSLTGEMTHVRDPVCGMQVEVASAPASRSSEGGTVYFCSDRCAEGFEKIAARAPVESPRSSTAAPRQVDRR